ncbi:maleylpyruvate isomerase N-terminal domain-containing protein [Brachybacterium hainanense]|uniref:Maleylpyruvate isomerase N-terminal domain-containing protein n=1 Tax=Brachybacterium hainanense TaxID=1541174 RepID=A0ABV6RD32_9MICO
MDLFSLSWTALRTAVSSLTAQDMELPSGCRGWLVRDLVCHLVIDAQDVLITLATPAQGAATADAATYWDVLAGPPDGEDPLDALIPRLAAAYGDHRLLQFHLEDLGAAAGRAAAQVDPELLVGTKDRVLRAGDYLQAYVLEWTLHHLDLGAHRPALEPPPAASLSAARRLLERILGAPLPERIPDADALLIGTGRRMPSPAQVEQLGELAPRLPLILG